MIEIALDIPFSPSTFRPRFRRALFKHATEQLKLRESIMKIAAYHRLPMSQNKKELPSTSVRPANQASFLAIKPGESWTNKSSFSAAFTSKHSESACTLLWQQN
jgi:hypothetical protein